MKKFLAIMMVAVLGATSFAASARADDNDFACIAVQPECGDDGLPLPPYNDGPCAKIFAARCAQEEKLPADVSCQAEKEELGKTAKRLAKMLRAERRKNRGER